MLGFENLQSVIITQDIRNMHWWLSDRICTERICHTSKLYSAEFITDVCMCHTRFCIIPGLIYHTYFTINQSLDEAAAAAENLPLLTSMIHLYHHHQRPIYLFQSRPPRILLSDKMATVPLRMVSEWLGPKIWAKYFGH